MAGEGSRIQPRIVFLPSGPGAPAEVDEANGGRGMYRIREGLLKLRAAHDSRAA
jgi:hypothetical protein